MAATLVKSVSLKYSNKSHWIRNMLINCRFMFWNGIAHIHTHTSVKGEFCKGTEILEGSVKLTVKL